MKYKILFVVILLFASFLRLYHLGSFPPSLTWDEAAIGYNAYGIETVHRDEWLNRMPLTFKSFGDYKSPLNIYITAVFVKILGLNEVAVRLPVALFGIGLVAVSYFLMKEILLTSSSHPSDSVTETISLLVMFLVAVSPWALRYSVIAFESMIATALAAGGSWLFLRFLRTKKGIIAAGSAVLYALSLYAYHSPKVVVPLTIITFLIVFRKRLQHALRKVVLFFGIAIVISLPLVYASVFGNASARFAGSTAIVDSHQHLKPIVSIIDILSTNFVAHLDPHYLLFGKDVTYRQSNMKDGILSFVEAGLILVGIIGMIHHKKLRPFLWIPILFLLTILPASLGVDVPHSNRALMGLPWVQIMAGIGLWVLCEWVGKSKTSLIVGVVVGASLCELLIHIHNDQVVYASSTALQDFQYGYKQAILYARSQESSVNKIYFTNYYGQAYIFILFYKQMNPIDYRGGGLANYDITNHPYDDAGGQTHVLIIGTPDEIPSTAKIEKEIKYPDGKVALLITRQ